MDPAAVEAGQVSEVSGTSEPEAEEEKNQYLYSSFTTSALERHRPIKTESASDRHDDSSSVIRFVPNSARSSLPSTPPTESATRSPRLASPSSRSRSPTHGWARGRSQSSDTDEPQPLNLTFGRREKLQGSAPPERRASMKVRKPKGLEISASSLLRTGSDLVSIALNSPALPSGSLTPAFLTAQV